MTKFILHGGFTRYENELNRSFYEEFMRDVPEHGTVLIVHFASREDDTTVAFDEQCRKFAEQAQGKTVNFVKATEKDFTEQFKEADAIYFHGGSTNKLLRVLRTYPDLRPLTEGKTIAGSSAGAYALAKLGASHSEDATREGLGWVPLRVVCHYESPELPPAEGAVSLLRTTSEDLELVLLKDCEWRMFRT